MKSIDLPPYAHNYDAPSSDAINTAAYYLTIQERHAAAGIVEEIVRILPASCAREALLAGATALRNEHPDVAAVMTRAYLSQGEVRP